MAIEALRYSILYGLGFYLLSALFYLVASRRLGEGLGGLGREARIEPVGLAEQGRPGEHVGAELEARLAHAGR